jgi:hypothetical protein
MQSGRAARESREVDRVMDHVTDHVTDHVGCAETAHSHRASAAVAFGRGPAPDTRCLIA